MIEIASTAKNDMKRKKIHIASTSIISNVLFKNK